MPRTRHGTMPGPSLAGCSRLHESIQEAATSGDLPVVEHPPP